MKYLYANGSFKGYLDSILLRTLYNVHELKKRKWHLYKMEEVFISSQQSTSCCFVSNKMSHS